MSTIAATYPTNRTRFPWLLLVIVLAASVVVGTQYSHALQRHADGAIAARNCFDRHGNAMRYYNPFRETFILACQEKPGEQVYVRIVRLIKGKAEEVSAYPKDHCYWLEDLAKILEDQGAILQWMK